MKKRTYFIVISVIAFGSLIANFIQYLNGQESLFYSIKKREELSKLREEYLNYIDSTNTVIIDLESTISMQSKKQKLINNLERSNYLEYKALKSLDLKEFQTDGSAVITRIKAGEKFVVLNSFFGDHWEVEYKGFRGWIITKEELYNEYGFPQGTKSTIERAN